MREVKRGENVESQWLKKKVKEAFMERIRYCPKRNLPCRFYILGFCLQQHKDCAPLD